MPNDEDQKCAACATAEDYTCEYHDGYSDGYGAGWDACAELIKSRLGI
jgi:hypothetical protein